MDIESYRGWALKLAAPYAARSGQSLLDSEAYGDACVGLLNAAKSFNPELGYDFSTFARVCIKRAIRDGINSRRMEKVIGDTVVRMTLSNDTAASVGDRRESVISEVQRRDESVRLSACMQSLPSRNRTVVEERLNGLSLEEIGVKLGITREGARRIETQAHILLRQMMLARSA